MTASRQTPVISHSILGYNRGRSEGLADGIVVTPSHNPPTDVDPLGGASAAYWQPVVERYGIDITIVNPKIDPTFAFMTVDHDGKIRMDCSALGPWQDLSSSRTVSTSHSATIRMLTGTVKISPSRSLGRARI
jgi:phosphoglucomutase